MDPAADNRATGALRSRGIDPNRIARWVRRATLPIAILAAGLFFLWFGAVRVPAGMDTMPAIPPGSLCLVDKRSSAAVVGDEVFVDLPEGGTLLSRVIEVRGDGLVLQNDNKDSQLPDSRNFGPLPRRCVRGVVITVLGGGQGPAGEAIRGK